MMPCYFFLPEVFYTPPADALAFVLADGLPNLNLPLAQGSDDAGPIGDYSDCAFSVGHGEIFLGRCFNGPNLIDIVSGFRYENVDIPANATITRAHLQFSVDGFYNQLLRLRFYGDVNTLSPTFSTSNRPEDRQLTNAWSYWYIPTTDQWEYDVPPQQRYSPNLASVAQEIVNLTGWQQGVSSLTFIVKPAPDYTGNQLRRLMAYDRTPPPPGPPGTYSARLLVWYTCSGSPCPTQ